MKTLLLIRGIPSSGKSDLARALEGLGAKWFEADKFYPDKFELGLLEEAHQWCEKGVKKAMKKSHPFIVVSNTFIKIWWMSPYKALAEKYGYRLQIVVKEKHHKGRTKWPIPKAKLTEYIDGFESRPWSS
jgi:predicted kinase